MVEEMSVYKAFKLAVAGLLTLVVAGYAVGVTVTGGISNPEHPSNRREWEKILLKFAQSSQTTDELLKNIKEQSAEQGEWGDIEAEQVKEAINERIERQRKLAGRKAKIPDGHRMSFGKQLVQDMEEGLAALFPDQVDIEIKSVLMHEPEAYEVMGGSKVALDDLMEYLVKASHDQGWLLVDAFHHEGQGVAYLTLVKDEREIFAVLLAREGVFEECPTVVYYVHSTEKYEDDEIPNWSRGWQEGEIYDEDQ